MNTLLCWLSGYDCVGLQVTAFLLPSLNIKSRNGNAKLVTVFFKQS